MFIDSLDGCLEEVTADDSVEALNHAERWILGRLAACNRDIRHWECHRTEETKRAYIANKVLRHLLVRSQAEVQLLLKEFYERQRKSNPTPSTAKAARLANLR